MEELIGLRTANSKTFNLGGRKRRAEIYSIPVHYKNNYKDVKEQWKDIDTTWRNGRIDSAPYAAWIDGLTLHYTDKQTCENGTIALEKIGGIDKQATQFTFEGRKATIKDFDTDLDLMVEAHPSGVRFGVVVKSDKAPRDLQYDIKGNLSRIRNRAEDADGNPLALTVSVKDGKLTESVSSLEVEAITGGKKAAKFPLRIDPEVTIQPSSKDTYLAKNAATTNYGTQYYLAINPSAISIWRSLLEQDATELPDGITISAATLYLYYFSTSATLAGTTLRVLKLRKADWVEAQATWNIYKTGSSWGTVGALNTTTDIDTSITADATVPAGYGWMTWNVLAHVQDAYANVAKIVELLLYSTEGDVGKDWYAYSNDYTDDPSLCPKLVVDFIAPASFGIQRCVMMMSR